MSRPVILEIAGHRIPWRELVAMRRAAMQPRAEQPALFELREDHRPAFERSAASRYQNPSLFDVLEL